MAPTHFTILYVRDPLASADFYARLLDRPVLERAPTFAMLPLADGLMLGLWRSDGVQPPVSAPAGGSELAFVQPDAEAVRSLHATWLARGATPAQAPEAMDFGLTFTVTDPDGHRLRVFAPAG